MPELFPDSAVIGTLVALLVFAVSHRRGRPPLVPLLAGLLVGVAVAVLLPSFLYLVTGAHQRPALHADVNHCTRGMLGQSQPREIVNICDEPIAVGLCLPGEVNPAPCTQIAIVQPGQAARFDPGDAQLSSLPSNPDGLTVVACRPPARPSRMRATTGRGHDGVCLPPG